MPRYGGYYGEVVGSFSHSYTDAYVRAGLGSLELFVDASVQLSAPDLDGLEDQDSIALDRVGGGARIRVGHEAVVEVRARYLRPMDEVNGIELESVYLARRKTAERVAAYAGGGFRYHRTVGRDELGDDELWFAHVLGLAGCMVQLDTRLAADFTVALAIPAADNASYELPSTATVGGRLLWVAERFDVFAGAAASGSGDDTVRELTVGVAGRLP